MELIEWRISELEVRVAKGIQLKNREKKMIKRQEWTEPGELYHNSKRSNICVISISEVEDKECDAETIFEKSLLENFSNLANDKPTHFKTSTEPNWMNPKMSTPRYITVKLKLKIKKKILKAAVEK